MQRRAHASHRRVMAKAETRGHGAQARAFAHPTGYASFPDQPLDLRPHRRREVRARERTEDIGGEDADLGASQAIRMSSTSGVPQEPDFRIPAFCYFMKSIDYVT